MLYLCSTIIFTIFSLQRNVSMDMPFGLLGLQFPSLETVRQLLKMAEDHSLRSSPYSVTFPPCSEQNSVCLII